MIGFIIGSLLAFEIAKKISVFFIKEDIVETLHMLNTELAIEEEIFLLNE